MKGWGLVYDQGLFDPYCPFVSIGGVKTRVKPYIYINGTWQLCGASNRPMVPLLDENDNYVYDADGNKIFIPRPKVPYGLKEAGGAYVKDSTGAQVYVW